ncbi:L-threonine ammonia-lyase [Aplysia californica]|uniref:L-serine deaminase n=1 Tax=Aplysia californica TaxID=6500 RepID=A0ABM0JF77_APLCA|nr:L-threonine ammonia-lyase [Aplysia californica]
MDNSVSICLHDVEEAQRKIKSSVFRTPLVPLNVESQSRKIYLKLENLQPIGSFKLRGACNAISCLPQEVIGDGVYTASAGNFAQGLAWNAKKLGIPCRVVMPDHAPEAKIKPTISMGADVSKVPFDRWWKVLVDRSYEDWKGAFIHPVAESSVIAGNGTIGLEILEDLPEVDSIIVPYGGGGLSSGIAVAAKGKKSSVKVFACEVDTAAPLSASFEAGEPVACTYTPSFVDGMGSGNILQEMWPLVREVLDDSLVVTLQQIAEAIRLLAEANHVIAEGAGAAPVAAALAGLAGEGNIVCVISGGNIDTSKLVPILEGKLP